MRLMDLLSEQLIQPALTGTTRDGVIGELVDLLVAKGAIPAGSGERVLAAVLQREASQSTGLGSAVAIPHGLSPDVEDIDGKPVRLVILLVVPPNMFQAHVRTLAGIARVLNDARMRERLVEAREAATILDVLIEREEAAYRG
jgi:nitrogen PTS system EIIA component